MNLAACPSWILWVWSFRNTGTVGMLRAKRKWCLGPSTGGAFVGFLVSTQKIFESIYAKSCNLVHFGRKWFANVHNAFLSTLSMETLFLCIAANCTRLRCHASRSKWPLLWTCYFELAYCLVDASWTGEAYGRCVWLTADIVFIVNDKPHAWFRREGVDLVHMTTISLCRALVGCTVEIHTLDDRVLHIPITDVV